MNRRTFLAASSATALTFTTRINSVSTQSGSRDVSDK
jgi:hypothetical protein